MTPAEIRALVLALAHYRWLTDREKSFIRSVDKASLLSPKAAARLR